MKSAVVVDLGSGETKAGLDGNQFPTCTIPTRIPEDADRKLIEHGIIQDFDQVECFMRHIFDNELRIRPEEHPILLTQPPKNPQKDKEKLAEILFETFQVPALYEEVHSVLTFFSSGRSAGLIVESGHGVTSVVPILSGYAISEAILRLDMGGGDIDQYLKSMLEDSQSVSLEEAKVIKENLCSMDRNDSQESYIFPDGKTINLTGEKYKATDPMFQPALVEQYDTSGIHEMIFESIFKCGVDLRRDFASNIILSGGNTLFNGLTERLQEELEIRVPPSMKVNIIADPDRKVLVWRGGAILSSLSTFVQNICVSKTDYDECGLSIIRKKCMNGL